MNACLFVCLFVYLFVYVLFWLLFCFALFSLHTFSHDIFCWSAFPFDFGYLCLVFLSRGNDDEKNVILMDHAAIHPK